MVYAGDINIDSNNLVGVFDFFLFFCKFSDFVDDGAGLSDGKKTFYLGRVWKYKSGVDDDYLDGNDGNINFVAVDSIF